MKPSHTIADCRAEIGVNSDSVYTHSHVRIYPKKISMHVVCRHATATNIAKYGKIARMGDCEEIRYVCMVNTRSSAYMCASAWMYE